MLHILLCFIFILHTFKRNASLPQTFGVSSGLCRESFEDFLSIKNKNPTGDGNYYILIEIQCLRHFTAFLLLTLVLWSGHIYLHFYEIGGRAIKEVQQPGVLLAAWAWQCRVWISFLLLQGLEDSFIPFNVLLRKYWVHLKTYLLNSYYF